MGYAPITWVNGTTPVNATNMNHIETFLASLNSAASDTHISSDGNGLETVTGLKINPSSTVLNGATSGTATLYQGEQGTFKRAIVVLSNFWNNGGSTQTIALPTPFTTFVIVRTHPLFQIELRVAGVAQSISILTTLSTGGGSASSQSFISANSFGTCAAAVDTIGFRAGGSAAITTSLIILEGI